MRRSPTNAVDDIGARIALWQRPWDPVVMVRGHDAVVQRAKDVGMDLGVLVACELTEVVAAVDGARVLVPAVAREVVRRHLAVPSEWASVGDVIAAVAGVVALERLGRLPADDE